VSNKPLLRPDLVVTPLQGSTLAEVLPALARRMGSAGIVRDADSLAQALTDNAARAAVRVGPDVALPHYRTDAVETVAVCLGVSPNPLRTHDPEWKPGPRIVALVLAPTEATTAYLQTVSALARALRTEGILDRLLSAGSAEEVVAIPGLASLDVKPKLTVRDVMTETTDTATPDESVRSAVEHMIRSGTRALIVVGEKGEVLGMVSEADVMRGLARSRPPGESMLPPLKVRDVMSRSVMCTADRASLDEVANIMINKDVEEVPVVAEGRLTGLVRRGDILRTLYGR